MPLKSTDKDKKQVNFKKRKFPQELAKMNSKSPNAARNYSLRNCDKIQFLVWNNNSCWIDSLLLALCTIFLYIEEDMQLEELCSNIAQEKFLHIFRRWKQDPTFLHLTPKICWNRNKMSNVSFGNYQTSH
jgi:hypothetical protein